MSLGPTNIQPSVVDCNMQLEAVTSECKVLTILLESSMPPADTDRFRRL
jgi:hypothetical protein